MCVYADFFASKRSLQWVTQSTVLLSVTRCPNIDEVVRWLVIHIQLLKKRDLDFRTMAQRPESGVGTSGLEFRLKKRL